MNIRFPRISGRRFESQINGFPDKPIPLTHFLLWQVGEYSAVPGYKTGAHPQTCLEIAAYLDGKGKMLLDDQEYPGQTGSIFVFPKGSVHATHADEDSNLRMFYLGFEFREEQCQMYPYRQMLEFYQPYRVVAGEDTVNLMATIYSLLSELYNAAPGYMQAIEHYVELIIMLAWRNFTAPGVSLMPSAYAYNALYNIPSVYAVVRYIDEHIQSIGDIRSLASDLGFSYAYLSHMFSCKTGIKLQDYVCRRKMEYARTLLSSGRFSVAEVAAKCGYQNVSAFSRAFQREIGKRPSEFVTK